MRGKPMVLIKDQNGCIVSTSHRLNKAGYLRIRDHRYKGKGRKPLIMAHRLVWEEANGEVFGVSFSSACRWIREWKCRD